MQTTTITTELWNLSTTPLPLKSVRIEGHIKNFSAHLSLTQNYVTPLSEELGDVLFEFPLYDLGVVTGFEVFVGSEKTVAVVDKKTVVDKRYHELTNTTFSSHLDLNSTDIFICKIRKTPQNTPISIKISFICENLFLDGDLIGLVLPPTITPRVYHHETLNPKIISKFQLSMSITVEMFDKIKSIRAPPSKNQPSQQQQQLTKTEVEKKVEQFLIEFQDSEESEVAYRCFLDVQGPFTPVETVNKALCLALDGNDRDRKIFLGLLRDFSSEWNVLTEEHFLEGYALVLSNINDYAIDIPHAYKYMANFILFATTNNLFPPSALENLMKPTVCSGDAAKIISELLLTLSLDQSLEAAKAYAANFDFKKFLKAEQQTKEGYSRYLQNNVSLIPILQ